MSGADHMTRASIRAARSALDAARAAMCEAEPDTAWLRQCRAFDPAKAIAERMIERLTGVEKECTDELNRRCPHQGAGNFAIIPFETIAHRAARHDAARAAIIGSGVAGGFLVEQLNAPNAAQALMSMLVLDKLGATALDATNNAAMALPKLSGGTTAYYAQAETGASSEITESDPTFSQQTFSPHTVGVYCEASRQLILQSSPSVGDVVATDLRRRIKRAVEGAAFSGPGNSGQPLGLLKMASASGINTASGGSFSLATAVSAMTATADAMTDDMSPGFAVNRSVAGVLRQRVEVYGAVNGVVPLWRGPLTWGALADVPAGSTSGLASGTGVFGSWGFEVLMTWSGGLAIEVNPYADFKSGVVGMRGLLVFDVGPVWASAFTTLTGIT